jgi:hypothetical protein
MMVDAFWSVLGGDVLAGNKYDSHPETARLKPWLPAMYAATSYSILNYDTDFFQLVRDGKIRVHISEITHLSRGKVHLADGVQLDADVLLANTGWTHVPPVQFLPAGIDRELGLPHTPDATTTPLPEDLACNQSLLDETDTQILTSFPRLRNEPVWNKSYTPITKQKGIVASEDDAIITPCTRLTPFMLHRFIVPPSARFLRTRDVAFVGMVSNFSNVITAHVQGLWVGAYFARRLNSVDGLLLHSEDEDGNTGQLDALRREALLHNRFGRWRYPVDWGAGGRAPSFIFDAVPYLDMLLGDLGVENRRKGGVFAEVFSPYGPEDYRAVNEEWAAAARGRARA